MQGLIRSLAAVKPKLILLSVDGPKMDRMNDLELVRQTQEMVNEITWDADIKTRFRESNLGLRKAVVDAVTWANSEYGRVIVLEDDVRAGPQTLDFLIHNLIKHDKHLEIAHINGYNLVPMDHITNPGEASRLSIYPESYAWATWERAWSKYDDDMGWATDADLTEIESVVGTKKGAIRWAQNFSDAANERIDTWAYRWLASMWEHRWLTISPNRNLSNYLGTDQGTHTRRRVKWSELEIEELSTQYSSARQNAVDARADSWISKYIFKENYYGVFEGLLASTALSILKVFK
jgi:hypothetical protein